MKPIRKQFRGRPLFVAMALASLTSLPIHATQVGGGSYRDGLPSSKPGDPGWAGPSQITSWGPGGVPSYGPAVPKFKTGVPVVSNKWWTGLGWNYWGSQASGLNSVPNYPLPLSFMTRPSGAGVWQPDQPSIMRVNGGGTDWMAGTPIDGMEFLNNGYPNSQQFHFYDQDLVAGLEGLVSGDPLIAGYSDWAVTAEWSGGGSALQMTSASGSPYMFFKRTSGTANARVEITGGLTVFASNGNVLGISVSKAAANYRPGSMHHYLLVAPAGVNWAQSGSVFTAALGGKGYFTVAALPDTNAATVAEYAQFAHNHVTNTQLTWNYNESSATIASTYTFSTTNQETGATNQPTLSAVFRHTWNGNLNTPVNTSYTYASPRGQMKVVKGTSYTSNMRFNGVLPALPVAGSDVAKINSYINEVANDSSKMWQTPPEGDIDDAYWSGRAVGRLASLLAIAAQTGNIAARDKLLLQVKMKLQDWLTYSTGENGKHWAYDSKWRTLCPIYDMHYACRDLSDHHFINGYFIRAAAIVAMVDPNSASWVTQWGPMIEKLVKDPMNWDRSDSQFAFLRHYSPVEGHSWASGMAFGNGLNEESSSEGMNFATGATLWGIATGNKAIRDLGIMYYANQSRSIEEYWMDVDQVNYATDFRPPHAGMVWSNGQLYGTWWTAEPRAILGINLLPITSGSVYLGRRPDHIPRQLTALKAYQTKYEGMPIPAPPGIKPLMGPMEWSDLFWSLQANHDPATALSQFNANPSVAPEWGQSKADIYNYIAALANYGKLDTTVTANVPSYNVFNKNGVKSYAAYNPGATALCVTFSDGRAMSVASRQVVVNGPTCSGGGGDTAAPSVPSGLTVGTRTSNSVALTWSASTDNVGVTGYEVLRNGTVVGNASGTSFTSTELAANTTYSFAVRALDAAGNRSANSANVSATTSSSSDTTPPTVPTNVAILSVTASTVSVRWSASSDDVGVTGYQVYRNGVLAGSATGTTFTDTNLSANTSYTYTVRAMDAAGNASAASAGALGKTSPASDATAPSVPSGLSVTGSTASSVSLSWSASTDNVGVTGYQVLRNGVQAGTATGTSFTDTGLTAATAYQFAVKARDAAGNVSAASAAVTGTTKSSTGSDTTAPSVPTGVTVTATSASSVSLSWYASTDNVGVTGYQVLRNGVPAGTVTGTSFTDTGLAATTAYSYTVKARDAAGNSSGASTAVTGTTSGGGSVGFPARSKIQVEGYTAADPRITKVAGGTAVGTTLDGAWIKLPAIDFGSASPVDFVVSIASGLAGSGSMTLYKDSIAASNQIASMGIGNTGGWAAWQQFPMNLTTPVTGVHDVYIKFNTPYVDPNGLVNLDWIQFR